LSIEKKLSQVSGIRVFLDAIASLEIPIVVVTHSLTQSQLSLEVLFPFYTMLYSIENSHYAGHYDGHYADHYDGHYIGHYADHYAGHYAGHYARHHASH
jgi:hypothetical protein